MNRQIQIAPVRKSIVVDTTPQHAFEVFTKHIDRWWPKTHGIGTGPIRESVIEGFVGGRWLQRFDGGSEVTAGHVRVWEPGARLTVSWEINAQWKPDARANIASEVDVRFIAESAGSTRVELEHRDFEKMGVEPGEIMRKAVDDGWPSLLQLFAAATSSSA